MSAGLEGLSQATPAQSPEGMQLHPGCSQESKRGRGGLRNPAHLRFLPWPWAGPAAPGSSGREFPRAICRFRLLSGALPPGNRQVSTWAFPHWLPRPCPPPHPSGSGPSSAPLPPLPPGSVPWVRRSSEMAAGMGGLAGYLWLLSFLGGHLAAAEDVLSQVAFVQRSLDSDKGPSEFMFDFDGDEIFHVDLEQKETVWRLPQFQEFTSFQAEGAQGNIAVLRSNLDILMKRSNYTPAQNVAPKVTVYPEKPVALGEPNMLICLADEFSPPVIHLSWWKNGQEVADHVEETDFYPNTDNSFRKFSYLPFVPDAEDIYYCRVEHWGLAQPLTKEWNTNMPEPLPETGANVVCGLGLAVGIMGIIAGTVLIIKSRQRNEANFRRRPM